MSDDTLLGDKPPNEATELAALARALMLGTGHGFALLFACISDDAHRQRLELALIAQVVPWRVLRLTLGPAVPLVLDELAARFEAEIPDALSVSGLEQSIFQSRFQANFQANFQQGVHETAPVLAGLNIGRSSFLTRVPCPLLLWMTRDALALLAHGAPDFFAIRSGVYWFEGSVDDLVSPVYELQILRDKVNPPLAQLESLFEQVNLYSRLQPRWAGQAFFLLGDCFLKANRPDRAEQAYYKAQAAFYATASLREYVQASVWLGRAQHRGGHLDAAEATLLAALARAQKAGLQEDETLALLSLGEVQVDQGKPFAAGDAFERAFHLAHRLGRTDWVSQARLGLSDSGKRVGAQHWEVTRGPGEQANLRDERPMAGPAPTLGPHGTAMPPTRVAVRRLLSEVFRTDSDLDAFCFDYFPEGARRFSSGMDRLSKANLLLALVETEKLVAALTQHDPDRVAQYRHLLT